LEGKTLPAAVFDIINQQIEEARADLQQYRPLEMDWPTRAKATVQLLMPWLAIEASEIKSYVEDVLNAPVQLRRMWSQIRTQVDLPAEKIEAFDHQLSLDDVLRESVTGEVVSKVVTKYLTDNQPDLRSNGRSDYPDLYLGSLDYSGLTRFQRKRSEGDVEYGAALKGAEKRPVRVPDGLEIKTCRNQIRVDCHHPHAGLHLVLVFEEVERIFTVTDLRVAFLRLADYHEAGRNTTATTVKFSFNGDRFVSLFSKTQVKIVEQEFLQFIT
jgi:hypothetical protein